jgi:transposase
MSGKRRRYTPEFREQAARLVIETGRSVAHVAAEIGVGEQVLGRWARLADDAGNTSAVLDADERAELERLRRENAELRLDREFLKKVPSSSPNRTGRGLPGDRGGEGHLHGGHPHTCSSNENPSARRQLGTNVWSCTRSILLTRTIGLHWCGGPHAAARTAIGGRPKSPPERSGMGIFSTGYTV